MIKLKAHLISKVGADSVKRCILTLVSAAVMAQPAFCETLLREGTQVDLKVLDAISSSSANEGEIIRMEVASDVFAEDGKTIVIKAGTGAKAYIGQVSKRRPMGEAGSVSITARSTKSIDGSYVPLIGTLSRSGQDKDLTMRMIWLGFLAAYGAKGEDGKINPGLILHASVDRDTPIAEVKPQNPELSGH